MTYRKSDEQVAFDRLIDQLTYAVEKFHGRTCITETDLETMRRVARQLARYDEMAAR